MAGEYGQKQNLLGADRKALCTWMAKHNQPAYRARQLMKWVHGKNKTDISCMHDLAKSLRQTLENESEFSHPAVVAEKVASDGTRKFIFDVGEASVEAVWIPEQGRNTLCISSQAGCPLACTFCLTGMQGFAKNLESWQIMGQYHAVSKLTKDKGRISNVVFMGMGEPLLNMEQVVPVLHLLTDDLGPGLSRRKVTVSTAGVVPGIDRLREEIPVALAVSLHSADNDLRSELVPLNRRYPLAELIDACKRYLAKAPRDFITFEYVLLDRVNDSFALARDLVRLLDKVPGKVNLIPFNPFPGAIYKAPSRNRVMAFRDTLNQGGITATIRRQRGDDILAACGQLAGKIKGRIPSSGRIATPIIPAS